MALKESTKIDQNGLSVRQLKALPYFISPSSEVGACKAANISKQTYYSWLKEENFREELKKRRKETTEEGIEQLKASFNKAVSSLTNLLETENVLLRRNVANDIIQYFLKNKEYEVLETKIEKLEQKIQKNEQNN